MSRRKPSSEVEIFSFSFLDILACTVGALAFILAIMLLNVSGAAQKENVLQEVVAKLEELREQLVDLQTKNQSLASQKEQLAREVARMTPEAESLAAKAERDKATVEATEAEAKKARIEADELAALARAQESQLQRLQEEQIALQERSRQLQTQSTNLVAKREEWNQKFEQLKVRYEELTTEYEAALAAQEENSRLLQELKTLEESTNGQKAVVAQQQSLIAEVKDLETELSEIIADIKAKEIALIEAVEQEALAQEQATASPNAPPYLVLLFLALVTAGLAVYWVIQRGKVPAASLEEMQAQTKSHREAIEQLQQEVDTAQQEMAERSSEFAASDDLSEVSKQAEAIADQAEKAERDKQDAADALAEQQEQLRDIRSRMSQVRKGVQRMKHGHAHVAPRPIEGPGGANRKPVHVECCSDGVVIHPQRERVTTSQISNARSAFGRVAREVAAQKKTRCIVLWIRPDGYDAFEKARESAQECNAGIGWEPADAQWDFVIDETELQTA